MSCRKKRHSKEHRSKKWACRKVAASSTRGCSLQHTRLQPPAHAAAGLQKEASPRERPSPRPPLHTATRTAPHATPATAAPAAAPAASAAAPAAAAPTAAAPVASGAAASTCSASAQSAAQRARGPYRAGSHRGLPVGVGTRPRDGARWPRDGARPTTPQKAAATRTEPAVPAVPPPRARGVRPAATAAAAPAQG